tara:strand:+ start:37 stop:1170 length:1134 start_codon:yes stop_codon:yes gene_type:complete
MQLRKKYRIFIFQPYPKFGGADRSIIRLINGNNNADFTLISLTKCHYGKYLNKRIKYLKLKSSRVLFSIFELKNKIKTITQCKKYYKNIFISNQNFANIISIIALNKISNLKTVLIERNHFSELKQYKNIYDYFKKFIMLTLIKINYKKSNAVVGISKKLSKDLSKFINKKVITIYNPALDRQIFKKANNIINIDKYYKKNKNIILNVGFFEKQKDQITILKAFNIVKKKFKNIHLILIGRGSKYDELKQYVKNNNLEKNVDFLTNVNDPIKFYKLADLFVLSSIYEGFGNVLVEALHNKCPVITSNCNSGPMEIIKRGKYGDFFNVGDYMALSNKIIKFLENPKKLKRKALKLKKNFKEFTLKKNSENFQKLFKKI